MNGMYKEKSGLFTVGIVSRAYLTACGQKRERPIQMMNASRADLMNGKYGEKSDLFAGRFFSRADLMNGMQKEKCNLFS